MLHAWVIGCGGMLGGAISRGLQRQNVALFQPSEPFCWAELGRLRRQFHEAISAFISALAQGDQWEIYWAAGIGYMGSAKSILDRDVDVLRLFLIELRASLSDISNSGRFGFASSAGALYSGCKDFAITEASAVAPTTDYAYAKLSQEGELRAFALSSPFVSVLIARFSTLYGPGQSSGKPQGLLTHIARSILRQKPVEIFVPLDTSRDYLLSDDAANAFTSSLRTLSGPTGRIVMKIIASEQSVSISEILSLFRQLTKKPVRVYCNRNDMSGLYASRVSFRSMYPENRLSAHTLLEGVSILFSAERMNYIKGALGV